MAESITTFYLSKQDPHQEYSLAKEDAFLDCVYWNASTLKATFTPLADIPVASSVSWFSRISEPAGEPVPP